MALFSTKNLATRQQLEWLVLAVVFAGFGAAGVVSHNVEAQHALVAERARVATLVDVVSSDMALNLDAMDLALSGIVRDHPAPFENNSQVVMRRHLRAITEAMPGMRGASVINERGVVTVGFPVDLVGRDFANRYFYEEPKRRPDVSVLYLSPPYKSMRKDVVISATRMIAGPDGAFAGAVNGIRCISAPACAACCMHPTSGRWSPTVPAARLWMCPRRATIRPPTSRRLPHRSWSIRSARSSRSAR
jgi:hypothetical protein